MRRRPGVEFLVLAVIALSGCFEESGRRAAKRADVSLSRAIAELEQFGRSRSAVLWGQQLSQEALASMPAAGQTNYQKLMQAADDQIIRFDAVIRDLQQSTSAEAASRSKNIALAYGMIADLQLLRARWEIDRYRPAAAALLPLEANVRDLALEIRSLKSELDELNTQNLAAPIEQTQGHLDAFQKSLGVAEADLQAVDKGISQLEELLKARVTQRDAVNLSVTKLTEQLGRTTAEEAVKCQERINDLERERFEVSEAIDRLQTGPYTLGPENKVALHDRELTAIGGLQQLGEEKAILQGNVENLKKAVTAEKSYLEGLQTQAGLRKQQAQEVAGRIDQRTKALEAALANLGAGVQTADRFAQETFERLHQTDMNADAAQKAAGQYFSAVQEAARQIDPARKDAFLEEAQAAGPVALSFDGIAVDALLADAQLLLQQRDVARQVLAVLQLADPLVKLNEALTAYRTAATRPLEQPLATTTATTGPADQTEADAKKKIDQAIALSDKASKQATSGEFKALTLANLAAVYYRASLLLPAESERWLNSAKETCLELMKQRVDPKSPIAGLVLQLQSVLEIQPPKPGSAETGA